ncbi:MAG: hypothetical protein IJ830_03935 [Alphaproteobacteria bacterium]|nr:hypothetical protein [Alphaproteobacteria bacterium]
MELLKIKKGWFVLAYFVGVMYFVYSILWREDIKGNAEFANIMLMVFAHVFTLGACAFSDKNATRRRLLLRELAIFVPVFSVFIFFTPRVMGLIGGFAIFAALGYFQTGALKGKDVFEHIAKAKSEDEATSLSDEQLKYALWLVLTAVPMFTLYWHI